MSRLADLFEETAQESPPPSGWTVEDVYTRGLRRRRIRAVAGAGGVVAVVAMVVAVSVPIVGATGRSATTAGVGSSASPRATPAAATIGGRMTSLTVTPSGHLYAMAEGKVHASTDNGRTWEIRHDGPHAPLAAVTALGDDRVQIGYTSAQVPGGGLGGIAPQVSVDGGRTWRPLRDGAEPLAEVPAGGVVQCAPRESERGCRLAAFDPVSVTLRPLATQPPLTGRHVEDPMVRGGRIWVSGADPTTMLPAVSVSTDRGRSWSTHVFTDLGVTEPGRNPVVVGARDGRTAYALVSVDGVRRSLRTDDGGGSWRDADPGRTLHQLDSSVLVTRDGGHVVHGVARSHDSTAPEDRYRVLLPGRDGYRAAPMTNLPESVIYVGTSESSFVARDADGAYVSDDGLSWRVMS